MFILKPKKTKMNPRQPEIPAPPVIPEQAPVESTGQRAIDATPDLVMEAVQTELDDASAQMQPGVDPRTLGSLRDRFVAADNVKTSVQSWARHSGAVAKKGQKPPNFRDFLQENIVLGAEDEATLFADNWVGSSRYFESVGNVIRKKDELQAAETTSRRQQATEAARTAETAQKAQNVQEARGSVEQARSLELFDDIVRLCKNKTQLHSDIDGFRFMGDGPKNEQSIAIMSQNQGGLIYTLEGSQDWREHPNEAVSFTKVVESEMRDVQHVTQVKGRFGKTKSVPSITTQEKVPGTEKPKLIVNELTGRTEPTVRFKYRFNFSNLTGVSSEVPKYATFHNSRNGQHINVGLDLPESVANTLQARIQQDPASVRALVKKLYVENSDGSVTEELWKQGHPVYKAPIRPPYEALPKDWNITLINGIDEGGIDTAKEGRSVQQLHVSS
jgi:hypothetical protein